MTEENKQQSSQEIQQTYNKNLVETHVRFLGNMTTIAEVVKLLAYIRHAIKNNLTKDISVKIGHNIVNTDFMFDVNGLEIQDYIAQNEISIN